MPAGLRPGIQRVTFKPLAPGDWSRTGRHWVDEATFEAGYAAQLAALDPQAIWDRLHELAGGAEPVLPCWERLEKPGEKCHRRLAAAWFEQALGIAVPEL